MSPITTSLVFDILVVVGCATLLVRDRRLSALHPAFVYFPCHLYIVTLRLSILLLGSTHSSVLYGIVGVREIARISAAADIVLVCSTCAWLNCRKIPRPDGPKVVLLNSRIVTSAAVVTMAIGIFGLLHFGAAVVTSRSDPTDSQASNYLLITAIWPILALLMLHYTKGFSLLLTSLSASCLYLMSFNAARFAVVVSVTFMCFTYISRRRLRWFPSWMFLVMAALFAVWFPMKVISASLRTGESIEVLIAHVREYTVLSFTQDGGGADTHFLDTGAAAMAVVDAEHFAYGRVWLPVITLPIPRAWWSNKPVMDDFFKNLSEDGAELARMGTVPTLAGDLYVNFGWLGVVVGGYLLAYVYGQWYLYIIDLEHAAVARFLYIVFLASMVQVLRDGVTSIVFPLIYSMPMVILSILHYATANAICKNHTKSL